jgi:hypothetical protein
MTGTATIEKRLLALYRQGYDVGRYVSLERPFLPKTSSGLKILHLRDQAEGLSVCAGGPNHAASGILVVCSPQT